MIQLHLDRPILSVQPFTKLSSDYSLVVARVFVLVTPESILLTHFGEKREESNVKLRKA
jgi:hypothetical protein